MWIRTCLLCLTVATVSSVAQTPAEGVTTIEAMKRSLAAQLASVEKQKASLGADARGFYAPLWEHGSIPPARSAAPNPLPSRDGKATTDPAIAATEWPCEPIAPDRIGGYIAQAAAREGIEPVLLHAVIQRESDFHPCAVSSSGARGLMQLMPDTAAALGVKDPFDPRQSIDAGAQYLGDLVNRYAGNLELVLGAYNAGPSSVDEYGGVPPFPETQGYVHDIMDRMRVQPLQMSVEPLGILDQ